MNIPVAKDFMARHLTSFNESTPVLEALGTLLHRGYSGAPVTDAEHRLLGIYTEHDAIRDQSAAAFHDELGGSVGDHMTREVDTVEESTDLFAVVRAFRSGRRRLPVTRDGKLVGMVCRRDLLQALEQFGSHRRRFLNLPDFRLRPRAD